MVGVFLENFKIKNSLIRSIIHIYLKISNKTLFFSCLPNIKNNIGMVLLSGV